MDTQKTYLDDHEEFVQCLNNVMLEFFRISGKERSKASKQYKEYRLVFFIALLDLKEEYGRVIRIIDEESRRVRDDGKKIGQFRKSAEDFALYSNNEFRNIQPSISYETARFDILQAFYSLLDRYQDVTVSENEEEVFDPPFDFDPKQAKTNIMREMNRKNLERL